MNYTIKIGMIEINTICMYCDAPDTPKHTLVHCQWFKELRQRARLTIEVAPSVNNIGHEIVKSSETWKITRAFARAILKTIEE